MRHRDAVREAFDEGFALSKLGGPIETAWERSTARSVAALDLGATGARPYGQAGPTDEGELRLGMVADFQQAIVRIEFGKPVAFIGLPASTAREFARVLIEKADALERYRT